MCQMATLQGKAKDVFALAIIMFCSVAGRAEYDFTQYVCNGYEPKF